MKRVVRPIKKGVFFTDFFAAVSTQFHPAVRWLCYLRGTWTDFILRYLDRFHAAVLGPISSCGTWTDFILRYLDRFHPTVLGPISPERGLSYDSVFVVSF